VGVRGDELTLTVFEIGDGQGTYTDTAPRPEHSRRCRVETNRISILLVGKLLFRPQLRSSLLSGNYAARSGIIQLYNTHAQMHTHTHNIYMALYTRPHTMTSR